MEQGDFDPSLREGEETAIILTQSWCPQWKAMQAYLPEAEKKVPGVSLYFVEYDQADWASLSHEDFLDFKERAFHNQEIPYIRYYRKGVFHRDSNFVSLQGFLDRLQKGLHT